MKRLSSARKDLALLGLWRIMIGSGRRQPRDTPRPIMDTPQPAVHPLELAPNDPLMAYFQSIAEAVDLDKINPHGPALQTLKAAGIQVVVPLVSQGELIGLLGLGPRRSEQDYSADDRALLTALATRAARLGAGDPLSAGAGGRRRLLRFSHAARRPPGPHRRGCHR